MDMYTALYYLILSALILSPVDHHVVRMVLGISLTWVVETRLRMVLYAFVREQHSACQYIMRRYGGSEPRLWDMDGDIKANNENSIE